jgi:hypothetical protein
MSNHVLKSYVHLHASLKTPKHTSTLRSLTDSFDLSDLIGSKHSRNKISHHLQIYLDQVDPLRAINVFMYRVMHHLGNA